MKDKWVSTVRRVDKPWGHEEIFALSEGKYCGKAIHVTAGHALSLQYHEQKEETIAIFSGTAFVEVGKDEAELDGFEMLPGRVDPPAAGHPAPRDRRSPTSSCWRRRRRSCGTSSGSKTATAAQGTSAP